MTFTVSVDQFDGPLDLMLHLIKENKLDLMDLNMDVLTEQYIAYIHSMQDMHLEIASEYLTELAGLIEYKSKKLLPREEVVIEEEYEEDHRQRLIQRLLEYQQYKEITPYLKEEYLNRQKAFSRPVSSYVEKWQGLQEEGTLDHQSAYALLKAMNRVMKRHAILQPYETKITIKELSIEERVVQIQKRLDHGTKPISFPALCDDCTNVHMVVVTFLGILDLIHTKWLNYTIDDKEEIWVMKGNENG